MIWLLFASTAIAAPCPQVYAPNAKPGSFLEKRLETEGVKLSKPEAWEDFVRSASLSAETKGFDQVDQDVFLRRLEARPLAELQRLYPQISAKKLKSAKAKVNPCAR